MGGLSFGTIPILSALLRDLDISSIEQVLIRLLIAGLAGLTTISYFYTKNKNIVLFTVSKSFQIPLILQGIILMFMIVLYLSSIAIGTPAGEAALLIQVQPIVTLILASIFLKERITKIKVASLTLALLGIIILLRPWDTDTFFTYIVGDILVLFNGVLYSLYILVGRKNAQKSIIVPSNLSIAWVLLWSLLTAIPIIIIMTILPFPNNINSFKWESYLSFNVLLLGTSLALFGTIFPYLIIMITSKVVESSRSAILLLGEPLGAIFLGALILYEQ
ncbi:MAG: DMT family transporter, partial [Candidatus Hodarchaeales archaeon]